MTVSVASAGRASRCPYAGGGVEQHRPHHLPVVPGGQDTPGLADALQQHHRRAGDVEGLGVAGRRRTGAGAADRNAQPWAAAGDRYLDVSTVEGHGIGHQLADDQGRGRRLRAATPVHARPRHQLARRVCRGSVGGHPLADGRGRGAVRERTPHVRRCGRDRQVAAPGRLLQTLPQRGIRGDHGDRRARPPPLLVPQRREALQRVAIVDAGDTGEVAEDGRGSLGQLQQHGMVGAAGRLAERALDADHTDRPQALHRHRGTRLAAGGGGRRVCGRHRVPREGTETKSVGASGSGTAATWDVTAPCAKRNDPATAAQFLAEPASRRGPPSPAT